MSGKGKKTVFTLLALLGAVIFLAGTSLADTCVTSKCHSGMGKADYVHGPVGAGQCVVCHTKGVKGHPTKHPERDFKFPAKGKALCYMCHQNKETEEFVHTPVGKGQCVACHDPHQSNAPKQLKADTVSALCFKCHENNKTVKKYVHGPVASGDCIVCHNPHTSPYKFQLEAQGDELCFLCHEDRKAEFTRKYVHKPAKENCLNCHDPHNTDYQFHLKAEGKNLCFRCHKKIAKWVSEATYQHGALQKGTCTTCHTPHSSNYPRQLKMAAKDICYSCHTEMGKKVRTSKYLHGPVQQNDCYACHNPHGSKNPKILKKYFPAEFYKPYKTDNYALCFGCHNKDIALDRITTRLTNFRNGDINLHYVHVNKKKGRSCKACHEVHAGNQPKHIRREVPFGKMWMLPVKYTKTETGGKCNVGCHKPKAYDRKKPVENK
ncbi:MAG: cytochrome C [Deltaproteobacteria bacterium]|nr:MAG: cytochrome C [Deltaproteobacteria bacterium]